MISFVCVFTEKKREPPNGMFPPFSACSIRNMPVYTLSFWVLSSFRIVQITNLDFGNLYIISDFALTKKDVYEK